MFLAFWSFHNFKVYQIDVKSAFLNGYLEEEVYIEQPEGFILGNDKILVWKLKKALYGLNKPHVHGMIVLIGIFNNKASPRGLIYIKMDKDKLLIVFFYVDDIIFGSNEESMSQGFASVMQQEFEMSLLGELT